MKFVHLLPRQLASETEKSILKVSETRQIASLGLTKPRLRSG